MQSCPDRSFASADWKSKLRQRFKRGPLLRVHAAGKLDLLDSFGKVELVDCIFPHCQFLELMDARHHQVLPGDATLCARVYVEILSDGVTPVTTLN